MPSSQERMSARARKALSSRTNLRQDEQFPSTFATERIRATGQGMRWRLLSALTAIVSLSFELALPAFADPVDIRLPSQPLSIALREFARQTGVQVAIQSELTDGKTAASVNGKYEPVDALAALLKGTGLIAYLVNQNTYGIREARTAEQKAEPHATSGDAGSRRPPAQTNPGDSAKAAEGPEEKSDSGAAPAKSGNRIELEEVVVTGSRIPLEPGQKQAQPLRSYAREDIERSGQGTLGEFLNTLPDVSTFTSGFFGIGQPGAETVQLHGLPIGTTLTLLDGRRVETNAQGFFDLSNIPVAAIERIEILPIGASAIYGADSLAGAVNTILRKDFSGLDVNATLDHAPGVDNPRVDLAWGRHGERGSVSLIGSYESRGELLGTQRAPTSSTQLPAGLPATALSSDTCAPGNVYSVDGSNLPGLSAPFAAIPAGISGVPTVAQFAATAGKSNVCNAGRYFDITPESQRESALLSAYYNVGGSMDLFAEALLSHQHLRSQIGPELTSYATFLGTLAADNPYNPFGQAVNVSFIYPGSGIQELQSQYLIRPMVGVRGALFSDWHYEVTATLSRDRVHSQLLGEADTLGISAALNSSDPATALNPFTSGAPGTPQLLNSILDTQGVILDDRIVVGQAILRGPLLQLPAGTVQAALVGEYGQERLAQTLSQVYGSGIGLPPFLSQLSLQRRTDAVSGETRVPLLAREEDSQRGERLTLTLAGRLDHSSDYGSKATWQSTLLWRTTEALSLTGGYGTSYRAPRLNEIAGPQSIATEPAFVIDPFRGNELAAYNTTIVSGPNFNLKPETGESYSLGVEYAKAANPGLRASFTWYELKISKYIGGVLDQTLVDFPNLFPGAVVRAPPTPQDQQQGFLGVITQLNQLYYNFGDISVRGFDADLSYALETPLGEFTPSLAIANVYRWQSALTPNVPPVDAVSKANLFGTGWAPRWKGTAAAAWKRGPLSANFSGRYIGRYLDYQELLPNTHETGNTWFFDVSARYEVGQALAPRASWLAGGYIALGAVNVFNKVPPFSYTSYWYDYHEYDNRGRYLHLSVGVRL